MTEKERGEKKERFALGAQEVTDLLSELILGEAVGHVHTAQQATGWILLGEPGGCKGTEQKNIPEQLSHPVFMDSLKIKYIKDTAKRNCLIPECVST